MILLGGIIKGIGVILDSLLVFALILVFARVVVSWVSADPFNPIVRFIIASTDPLLRPLRRYIPAVGQLDLTPLVLALVLLFLRIAVAESLIQYGHELRFRAAF